MTSSIENAAAPADLLKARTGMLGFDALAGGIPANRVTLVSGSAGSGKTVFAMQSVINGWRLYGERGVFVSFEEDAADLLAHARGFGWNGTADDENLRFIAARPAVDSVMAGDFDLHAMLSGIRGVIEKMGATRVVFDALDAVVVLLEDRGAERREFYRAYCWAKELRLTTIFTSKVDHDGLEPQHGFLEYLADCAIFLNHRLSDGMSVRALRIVKCRGSAHPASEFPMVLDHRGVLLSEFKSPRLRHVVFEERMSSGIPRLDTMLNGGFHRGSAVLISGAPGTLKTSLAGVIVNAACNRGQPALFVSFDETEGQITRNLRSIAIDLRPHIEAGLLTIEAFRPGCLSVEECFTILRNLLDRLEPTILVVDSISCLTHAGRLLLGVSVIERLLDYAKSRGVTLLLTTVLEGNVGREAAQMQTQISSLADTWISLSFRALGGEHNRAITVMKSRGTGHSHQVRELVLSDDGITLADVYAAGGEVLMGTARLEKERDNALEELQRQGEHARTLRENAKHQEFLRAEITERERRLAVSTSEADVLDRLELLRVRRTKGAQDDLVGAPGTGSSDGGAAEIGPTVP